MTVIWGRCESEIDDPQQLGVLLRPRRHRLREWRDPRRYNVGLTSGLSGMLVRSRNGTDAEGSAHAVGIAVYMVLLGYNDRIREALAHICPTAAALQEAARSKSGLTTARG